MTKKRGFTLTELLVVISIIGILSAVVMVGMKASRERAKVAKAKTDVSRIGLAVTMLYSDTRMYPGYNTRLYSHSADGGEEIKISDAKSGLVSAIRCAPPILTTDCFTNWNGPYLNASTNFKDPWGGDYYFDPDYYGPPYDKMRYAIVTYGSGFGGDATNDSDPELYNCNDIYFELAYHPSPSVTDLGKLDSYKSHHSACNTAAKFQGNVN